MQMALALNSVDARDERVNSRRTAHQFSSQLLKWVGNKQRQAWEIVSLFPERFGTYFEPFVGSAGVCAVLGPVVAEASDTFAPLVGIWQTLKSNPEQLKRWYADRYEEMHAHYDRVEGYETIKARYNESANSADLLFLCRACYGGVVRFRQRDGYMSTPCGAHQPIAPHSFATRVDLWKDRLKGTEFFRRDFQESFSRARSGDVIYCDPPYSDTQAILYGAQSFDLDVLFRNIERAKKRGVFVALSLDGTKKSGKHDCNVSVPARLFARDVPMHVGRSMLRRFQMSGQSLEAEHVHDRLLLTH